MTIYAVFLCFSFGQCQPTGDQVYSSLQECQQTIPGMYYGVPVPEPDDKGRYPVQGGAWYVCLSRHVDTWEEPQN